MNRALLSAVLSLSILLSTLVTAQDPSYTFTIIDVPGSISTVTTGINDRGQIVGRFRDAAGETHGLLIDGAKLTIIDVPGIRETTEANAINNLGQIVGIFRDAAGALHSFLKDGAIFTTFDVPGATTTFATGINDRGDIVGFFNDATGTHGFLTTDGGDTFTIIDVPNAESTQAFGINNRGQIVGQFNEVPSQTRSIHGFLTADGVTFTRVEGPNDQFASPRGISSAGQIAGILVDAIGGLHGFVLNGTTFTTIDIHPSFWDQRTRAGRGILR
jgi:probable HAF family extracellular repeat protein